MPKPNHTDDRTSTRPTICSGALTLEHRDILQRAMLVDLADDFKMARRVLLNLAGRRDMTESGYAEEATDTIRRVRLALDAMDALGWPNDPAVS